MADIFIKITSIFFQNFISLLADYYTSVFYQEFTVFISSACLRPTDVWIETIEEKEFFVIDDHNITLTVSPSQSRYFFYKFASEESDTLTIQVDSNDDACLIVSVQDSTVSTSEHKFVIVLSI